jgi:hypothetical protein
MKQQQDVQRRERAERIYARLLRLYPRAHRQAFGEPMLQAFRDHYCDAIETGREQTTRFWLSVIGDEGKSLLREYLAALAERIEFMKMLLVAPTLGLWRRRQTRGLALTAQLAMIMAVLLVWAPPLFGRVAFAAGLPDLVSSNPGLGTYCLSAAVERPTSSFITTFLQGTADIGAHELHAYHLRTSRVEISTYPLALAGPIALLPAVLLDGEPASRLGTDLRMVQGRWPVPSESRLEVVLTQTTAEQLHLTIGSLVPIAAPAEPLVRVVGIVQQVGTVFPTNRSSYQMNPDSADQVRYYAQENPLDYILTSDEAIGAYAFDWSQVKSVEPFFVGSGPGAKPLPPGDGPPLWQAWWIATADFSQMGAQDLNAFFNAFLFNTLPDPTVRLSQLLGEHQLSQQTGFVSADTTGVFFQGDNFGDYQNNILFGLLMGWLFSAAMAALTVFALKRVAVQLSERQQPVITTLRERGAGRMRIINALVVQALVLASVSFFVGGLLADQLVRLLSTVLVPTLAPPEISGLVGGPFDAGLGAVGGIAAALTGLVAVLVMVRATSREAALG